MLVHDVLQLHDSLRFLAERDVSVTLLQQGPGTLSDFGYLLTTLSNCSIASRYFFCE